MVFTRKESTYPLQTPNLLHCIEPGILIIPQQTIHEDRNLSKNEETAEERYLEEQCECGLSKLVH